MGTGFSLHHSGIVRRAPIQRPKERYPQAAGRRLTRLVPSLTYALRRVGRFASSASSRPDPPSFASTP